MSFSFSLTDFLFNVQRSAGLVAKVGYEFTANVDMGVSQWDVDAGHPLMAALEGLLGDDEITPRHALVAALVGIHG